MNSVKGPGRKPFYAAATAAGVGPMLREYVISEAMHALGIPTTRSLAVVATGERVFREEVLPGAILTRVAWSHLRVGTFEFFAARGDTGGLRELLDFAIARHDPDLLGTEHRALAFLRRVVERQAALIAQWLAVGFIHGVMNTDNMALSGETIDYGPCAFMDQYDPERSFRSINAVVTRLQPASDCAVESRALRRNAFAARAGMKRTHLKVYQEIQAFT